MYFCYEICTAALKYVLLHQHISCHSEICYPDGMHTLANHHHTVHYGHRPTNGSITASYRPHVPLPSSYRVLTVCHRLYPPGEKLWVCPKLSPGPAGSRRPLTGHQRVHRSLNAPPCAHTVFHRPHEIYHTVAHGRPSRCHVTATLAYRVPPCGKFRANGGTRWGHTAGRWAIGEHVGGPLAAGETRWDPAKVLGKLKTFRRVDTSGDIRCEPGIRTVRGRGAGTRPLWTRSWGGAHIILYSDGLRACACRLNNIFRSGNIYFGATIHTSEPQYIFQNNITYFRAPLHISEQHYKFQRRRYAHGEDTVRTTS